MNNTAMLTPSSIPSTSDQLLANREQISLQTASLYLASRARVQTPLGAAEYLDSSATHGPATFDKRVRLALDCLELYREVFPQEYARSTSPHFSTAREHEFYRLVHQRLFPLLLSEDTDVLTHLDREPQFFLPFIPMKGIQEHLWAGGCFDFQKIGLAYQLAQVLSQQTGAGGSGWTALCLHYGLPKVPTPAPPLAAFGWTHFVYACRVEETPLKHLPLAFHLITYKTGNMWLDLPQLGYLGFEWSREELTRLVLARDQANDLTLAVDALANWLAEDPPARIMRAVKLWNGAAELEQESDFAGMYVDQQTGELR
jgi:hypothetical protein